MRNTQIAVTVIASILFRAGTAMAVPYHQDREPGAALSPEQAIAKMQLPLGFKVECIVHEPEVVNPTAFTFDDRGRIWVCESTEYPRPSAGPGQDRVKILEDVNHNGKYEKVTIFKEGLNIPCGVALGNGGVYVTNSPDILFLQDTKGDGHADKQEIILTGFGRDDRHELPNSLTWGPDGWLYGMNGVFNRSAVKDNEGKTHDFTCAVWRYHPKTKKFELYAQGTSNPWGLDFNRQGDWFLSCCVIDHLFHITQSGYYDRQGGPYPPNTHKLPSITTQRHQAAAYAGLCFYDADVFPEEYRGTLVMGNLHGSAINRDTLIRDGSTYLQHSAPDLVSANDTWFMPVSEKVGPDGCLYVMDWYDRYHCYQDAGRDPKGVDRTMGRIYRISYNDAPRAQPFDLETRSKDELLKLLSSPNVWWRREAQRLLNEKFDLSLVPTLEKMALDASDATPAHMHALWLLVSQGALEPSFHERVLTSPDAPTRNWGARAVGTMGHVMPAVFEKFKALANDPSPDVRLQTAVAAGRLTEPDPMPVFMALLENPENAGDKLIPTIIYNNLKPLIAARGGEVMLPIVDDEAVRKNFEGTVVQWLHDALVSGRSPRQMVEHLKEALARTNSNEDDRLREFRSVIDGLLGAGLRPSDRAKLFDATTRELISKSVTATDLPARVPAAIVAMWWNDVAAIETARTLLSDAKVAAPARALLLKALAERHDPQNIPAFAAFVADKGAPILLRQRAVDALGEMDDATAARLLVKQYPDLGTDLKPITVNALVRSKASASSLLDAVAAKRIAQGDVNENHVRRIIALNDPELTKRVATVWGTVRTDRDPERVKVVDQMRTMIRSHPAGDPKAGSKVFEARCAQCHTIYGHGGDVGPNLTGVGRDNLEAILSNVLDPNLVVGAPYYQYVAKLKNGTVATGLLAEDTPDRIILRDNSQRVIIPRSDLKELRQTHLSMMPEGLEKTMNDQEFCDLVAFLLTREPPKRDE